MLSLTHFHTFRPTDFFSTFHTIYLIHLISAEREREEKEQHDLIVKTKKIRIAKKQKRIDLVHIPLGIFNFSSIENRKKKEKKKK